VRCLQRNVTCLHQKWCVHSILPLGRRAKQPDLHAHAKYTLQDVTATLTQSLHWDVELARFLLAAGGGEWSGPNMLLWLLFSFILGLRWGSGGNLSSPECVRNCHSCYGTLREPTMPNTHAQLCLCTAMRLEFITKHTLDSNKTTENF
jgi:hypothetical protein